MATAIPSDFAPFVQRLIAEKRFLSEDDVLSASLGLLQARESLREELQKGVDELDAGLGIPAEDVYAELEQQICDIENGAR